MLEAKARTLTTREATHTSAFTTKCCPTDAGKQETVGIQNTGCSELRMILQFCVLWTKLCSFGNVLSCTLLLVFSGLKWHILVTQFPKYTWLKRLQTSSHLCTPLSNSYLNTGNLVPEIAASQEISNLFLLLCTCCQIILNTCCHSSIFSYNLSMCSFAYQIYVCDNSELEYKRVVGISL